MEHRILFCSTFSFLMGYGFLEVSLRWSLKIVDCGFQMMSFRRIVQWHSFIWSFILSRCNVIITALFSLIIFLWPATPNLCSTASPTYSSTIGIVSLLSFFPTPKSYSFLAQLFLFLAFVQTNVACSKSDIFLAFHGSLLLKANTVFLTWLDSIPWDSEDLLDTWLLVFGVKVNLAMSLHEIIPFSFNRGARRRWMKTWCY